MIADYAADLEDMIGLPPQDSRTEAMYRLLQLKYPSDQWASFRELRHGTGYGKEREGRIDFLAIELWGKAPRVIAYEIKASRADFLRELDTPGKREFVERIATECWFVIDAKVQPGEIPDGWGLLQKTAAGLKRVVAAQQRKIGDCLPWPYHFIQSLARRSSDPFTPTSKAFWTVAGRDVTEDELLDLAQKALNTTVDARVERERRDAVSQFQHGEHYKELVEFRTVVGRMIGSYRPTVKDLETWASTQKSGLDGAQKDTVRKIVRALQEFV